MKKPTENTGCGKVERRRSEKKFGQEKERVFASMESAGYLRRSGLSWRQAGRFLNINYSTLYYYLRE
jgi:hypothetical protein